MDFFAELEEMLFELYSRFFPFGDPYVNLVLPFEVLFTAIKNFLLTPF